MGYPVTAYRTSAARADKARERGLQGANDNRPGPVQRLPSRKPSARYNMLKFGAIPRQRNPFGVAARTANRRALFGVVKGGLKLRRQILGAVSRMVLRQLASYAQHWWESRQNPGLQKHPGWTTTGRWGLYPYCSGKTSAHTNGQFVGHNAPPLVFGHPWGGVPFDWAEYDFVEPIENPITHVITYWFTQVGRGDQGTGPNPATYYAALAQPKQALAPMVNPWKEPYNPYWLDNTFPWPENFPKLPGPNRWPSFDPDDWPVNAPQPLPMPLPYPIIPHVPNLPWLQRGPQARPRVSARIRAREKSREKVDPFPLPGGGLGHNNPPPDDPPEPPYRPPIIRPRIVRPPIGEPWKPKKEIRISGPKNRPPGKGKKEKKGKAASDLAKWILRRANQVTEMQDLIDALFKGLPNWAKYEAGHMGIYGPTRRLITTPQGRWRALYNHFQDLDLDVAIRAVARNQLEDMIYGSIGAVAGKAANRRGGLYDPVQRTARKKSDSDYEVSQALAKAARERKKYFVGGNAPSPRSRAELDYWLDKIFGEDT